MKLAIPYENGNIYQHFGHTEQFKVYVVDDRAILSSEVVPTLGSGHGALAGFLQELGIDTLICGGIGAGAKNALAEVGIQLYGGVSGSADTAVQSFLDRTLPYNPDVACNHHHEGNHTCGSHGCGTHSCH